MSNLGQDFRYALRNLGRTPLFTAVALLSLALGIGANTAIFSLVNQVLLKRLPVKDPQRLVILKTVGGGQMGQVSGDNTVSYPMYKDLRDGNQVFDGLIGYAGLDMGLAYKGQNERVAGELVSGNFFDVLGVGAAIGRTLEPQDDTTPGAHPVAVISHNYWTRRFGGSPDALNRTVTLNGNPFTIVGVAQAGFTGPEPGRPVDVFAPITMKDVVAPNFGELFKRRFLWVSVMGRLKPGVTAEQAKAQLNTVYSAVVKEEAKELPAGISPYGRNRFLNKTLALEEGQRGRSQLRNQFSSPLLALMGMVGVVLLIACANVANLLMARAASRQKEVAIRLAIGASRMRIVQQLLVESVVLSLGGGMLGLIVAAWTGSFLLSFLPNDGGAPALTTHVDGPLLAFTGALAVLTGVVFGLIPALQSTRPRLAPVLKDQANSVSPGTGHVRIRKVLVAAQVGLSLLLLIGAGLFARSLYNLKNLNPGFRYETLLTFTVDPSLNGYSADRGADYLARVRNEVASIPGVAAASVGAVPLMSDSMAMLTVTVEGYRAKDGEDMNPRANWVGPAYFSTIGVPLAAGREFDERDTRTGRKTAIINETMARHFFPRESPIGRHIGIGRSEPDVEIVGVVRDAKQGGLRDEPQRYVYFPMTQAIGGVDQATYYVRGSGDPSQLLNSVRRAVQRVDSSVPVFAARPMRAQVDDSIFLDRVVSALSAFFGLLATLLAAIGLYGVMAYTVSRRTREIGIRMALGADRTTVIRIVMTEVVLLAGVGMLIALPVSYPLSRLVESQLFGIKANDPMVVGAAVLALGAVAFLSGYVPARRATRIDPMIALRYE